MTEYYALTSQTQENDISSAGCVMAGDDSVVDDSGQQEDATGNPNVRNDPSSTNTSGSSPVDGKFDDKITPVVPQPQEAAQAEKGLGVLGNGTSCGTFASTMGSGNGSQEQGEWGGLLAGGLAVAVSGHWRAAELQFEDTAQRVRSE